MATIPFIHNYCDRWCEKCRFSTKCAVGRVEACRIDDDHNVKNDAFWTALGNQFKQAIVMIENNLKERGIVLTEEDLKTGENHTQKKMAAMDEIRSKNELATLSREYSDVARKLINDKGLISDYQEKLEQQYTLGILSENDVKRSALHIKNNLDTIQWFLFFIHVKFMRALSPNMGDYLDDLTEEQIIQSDKNGTAKVAILAVESSIGAWHAIYTDGFEERDELLTIMAMLSKILRLANASFPDAMRFVRPGFDEGWQDVWMLDEEE